MINLPRVRFRFTGALLGVLFISLSISSGRLVENNKIDAIPVWETNDAKKKGKLDVSFLQADLKDLSVIDIQLFSDEPRRIFHRRLTNGNIWYGTEPSSGNILKLARFEGRLAGSAVINNVAYHITTSSDGSATRVEVRSPAPRRRLQKSDSSAAASCESGTVPFDLELVTDHFGHETKWKLRNDDLNQILLVGGPYDPDSLYTISSCVPADSCISFTIYDTGRDGLCCDFGKGRFVAKYNGLEVLRGDENFIEESVSVGSCPAQSAQKQFSLLELYDTAVSFFQPEQEEPKGPSFPCHSPCQTDKTPWFADKEEDDQKCDWEECKGCAQCSLDVAQEEKRCHSWCREVNIPWHAEREGEVHKCDWESTCADCEECKEGIFSGMWQTVTGWFKSESEQSAEVTIDNSEGSDVSLSQSNAAKSSDDDSFFAKSWDSIQSSWNYVKDSVEGLFQEQSHPLPEEIGKSDGLPCMEFCAGDKTPWKTDNKDDDQKCNWLVSCAGCSECDEQEKVIEQQQQQQGNETSAADDCQTFCTINESSWDDKCTWPQCAGCDDCKLPCMDWCAGNEVLWKTDNKDDNQKCDWLISCAGCPECVCEDWCYTVKSTDWNDPSEGKCQWEKCAGCLECHQDQKKSFVMTKDDAEEPNIPLFNLVMPGDDNEEPNSSANQQESLPVTEKINEELNPTVDKQGTIGETIPEVSHSSNISCKDWCYRVMNVAWMDPTGVGDAKCQWDNCAACTECVWF